MTQISAAVGRSVACNVFYLCLGREEQNRAEWALMATELPGMGACSQGCWSPPILALGLKLAADSRSPMGVPALGIKGVDVVSPPSTHSISFPPSLGGCVLAASHQTLSFRHCFHSVWVGENRVLFSVKLLMLKGMSRVRVGVG